MDLKERSVGCIVGAACGDALGMPVEYVNRETVSHEYGEIRDFVTPSKKHPCGHLHAGQYTDDTQQLMALAESIVDANGFSLGAFSEKLKKWYLKNLEDKQFKRFPGNTSLAACSNLLRGENPLQSGSICATTCGSVMRVAPIGVFYHRDINKTNHYAQLSSIPTHNSQLAREGAAFIAEVVAYLMNGKDPHNAVTNALKNIKTEVLKSPLEYILKNPKTNSKAIKDKFGTSEHIAEVIPFSIFAFLKNAHSFEDVVIESVNGSIPGDTDSIACITGACAGAFHGYNSIPQRFAEKLENRIYLIQLGESLAERAK